jgi:hypothetical protein
MKRLRNVPGRAKFRMRFVDHDKVVRINESHILLAKSSERQLKRRSSPEHRQRSIEPPKHCIERSSERSPLELLSIHFHQEIIGESSKTPELRTE